MSEPDPVLKELVAEFGFFVVEPFAQISLFKHEYLRSRAYIRLSLSSPFPPSVMFSQIWEGGF